MSKAAASDTLRVSLIVADLPCILVIATKPGDVSLKYNRTQACRVAEKPPTKHLSAFPAGILHSALAALWPERRMKL